MNILTKTSSVLTGLAMVAFPFVALADSASTDFESFGLGNVNGQAGWSSTGPYDQAVVANTFGFPVFGSKVFRRSNAIGSGNFGDQTFSNSLVNESGEIGSLNGGFSGGVRQPHFEAQFDMASTMLVEQPGLSLSVSPDRGDGARMSYLRFDDSATGIDVYFDDVQGTTNPANFVETQVASGLSRTVVHNIKFSMDFVAGASNDIVKIYIDGVLVHTGTSWENYYRYDIESNQLLISQSRTVDSLLFRTRDAALATQGKGYLFDNVSLVSGPTPVVVPPAPTNKNQCKKDGWKTFTNPSFKNQGECVAYTNHN